MYVQVAEPGAGCCRRSTRTSPWRSPAITIEQVLTRNAVASSIMTIDVPGSNHRSLLANISVPVVPEWAGSTSLDLRPKAPDFCIRLANNDALV